MKTIILLALLGVAGCATSSPNPEVRTVYHPAPSPIAPAPQPAPAGTYVYDQKPLQSQPVLIAPDQAQAIVERFKTAYGKLGQPRMLLYVNRELVDEKTGMKLIARTEKTDSTRRTIDSTVDASTRSSNTTTINAGGNVTINGSVQDGKGKTTDTTEKVSNENRYRIEEKNSKLADRQTVRDVERLFGRPLRSAGVALADQGVATQLIGDRTIQSFTVNPSGDSARKDREALAKITDVAIEVLISSRNVSVPEVSGPKTYSVPDIQATAIRLKDSKIIGQASSRDVMGRDRDAGHAARTFDVQEFAEATALALLDDIASSVK